MDRDTILQLLQTNLTKAQKKMKQQAGQHRVDLSFNIGDWVYLKLRPYRQLSAKLIRTQKLSKRFYGPFQILDKIGPVAYKLDLPFTCKIQHVFHISLLKPHKGLPIITTTTDLPHNFIDNHPVIHSAAILDTTAILDTRVIQLENGAKPEVLIPWDELPPEEATWGDFNDLEDKVALEDGRIDTIKNITLPNQAF